MTNRSRWWLAAAIFLAWLPAVIPAAQSAVWQWSQSASSNASADPQINWREGQPPSSVNDSARAMMAALASYRDDISGLLATTGTSTAYLVTSNQGLCASPATVPQDGQLLSVTMSATNGIAPTLQADTCSAYPIQSAAAVAVPSGTLVLGSPYSFRFSVANSAWMLKGFYGSSLTIPLGAMVPYTLTTVPNSNFVFPAGQCLSTTTYAVYWAALGSPASGSCPGGQFQIIDMSGRVGAGLDTMPGFSAANRLTSASTGCGTAMTSVGATCANGAQSATTTLAQLPTGITSSGTTNTTPIGGYSLPIFNGSILDGNFGAPAGSGNHYPYGNGVWGGQTNFAGTASVTSANTGGVAHPTIMPTIGLTYLLRVL